jgi:hypothetical protein
VSNIESKGRKARLAIALRENLRRRRTQIKNRAALPSAGERDGAMRDDEHDPDIGRDPAGKPPQSPGRDDI